MSYPRPPTESEWKELKGAFPKLAKDEVLVEGPATTTYNCIAWSLGYEDRWINPPAEEDAFVELFLKPTHPRVYDDRLPARAPTARADGYRDATAMTHASRRDGATWSSKLGSWLRVRHERLGVEGAIYGQVVVSFS